MKENELFDISYLIKFLSSYIKVREEEREALSQIAIYKYFKKNEIIHREGNLSRHMAFIVKGAIRAFYNDENGQEHTLEFAFENNTIGEFNNFIHPNPTNESAQALEDCHLLTVSYDSFIHFMSKYPRYYIAIATMLSKDMAALYQREKILRILSSRKRYEQLCETRPKVIQRIPLTYIASYLRMALGTLSRVRAGKL
ncbi:MAG: CRP-like cAMP-binding protein [Maribacter sp.]|jgi:CRP-like cAMP-binding protein